MRRARLLTEPGLGREFNLFWCGRFVSILGSAVAPVALAFAVLEASNSPANLGIVLAARSIPLVVFLLLGGVAADKASRTRVLVLTNLGAATTQGVAAWMFISGNYHLVSLVVLEACHGSFSAFSTPALRGIVPDLVARDDIQRANATLSSTSAAARVAGPIVAGALVSSINAGWAVAFDAATFLVASLAMSQVRLTARPAEPAGAREGLVGSLTAGFAVFWRLTWVRNTVFTFLVLNMLQSGAINTLGPIIAREEDRIAGWGVALGCQALGFFVGSLLMRRIEVRRLLLLGVVGILPCSLPLFAIGWSASAWVLDLAMFAAGVGAVIFGISWNTSLHEHVERRFLSRVSSYDDLGSFVAIPLGQLAAAPLGVVLGYQTAVLLAGVGFVLATLALLLLDRRLRSLPHLPPQ